MPKDKEPATLGESLILWRTERGFTLYAAAKAGGLQITQLGKWERNEYVPSLLSFSAYVAALGVDDHIVGQAVKKFALKDNA